MPNSPKERGLKERDPDIANVEIALRRAGQRARERAKRAGLKIPVYRDGQVVEEWPDAVRALAGTWPDFPDLDELRK